MDDKWSVHKRRCRHDFRDGCRPAWIASPPEDEDVECWWLSLEFDTWADAMRYVHDQIAV